MIGKTTAALLVAAATVLAALSAGSASAGTVRTKSEWQAVMAQIPEPGTGCYQGAYPALQWHAVKCKVAPKWAFAPSTIVGNGHDYSAKVSGLISHATGTFKNVSPANITEKGKYDNQGSEIANTFSLQLNTEFFSGSPACSGSADPANCLAWQQFVYAREGATGYVFMQYWLIDYNTTCPSGWFTYTVNSTTDCYTNSPSATTSPLTAKQLATLKFSGSAALGGNDMVSLSVGSGTATAVTNPDSMVDLAGAWNTTEWGLFGDAGGGEAYFGANTALEAQTALTATSSSAPKCVKEGFTGETNNLKLAKTPALGSESSPTMGSKQTNGTPGTASCAVAA